MPDLMKPYSSVTPDQLRSEEELVKRAQHTPEAFGELYEIYYSASSTML